MRIAAAVVSIGLAVIAGFAVPVADAHPSEPGVVSYAVLGKGSVGNIVGAPMGWEAVFTRPFQAFWVELPACNNWVDIGLPEVYDDPDLASFRRYHADVRHRPNPPGQAGGWGIRQQRCRRPGVSPRCRPNRGLLGADHRDPPGRRDDAGVVVRRWAVDRHRRGLDQTRGRHRSTMLCSNQAARKRIAAGQGLSVRQRRSRGQRAGRGNAEHTGLSWPVHSRGGAVGRINRWRLSFW